MTEVAIRLAEPDRMAEQSVASLGQAVRRQVSFMNDAVSRALGRAGELEAMVHNEVALERSYEENERKIRGLISELSGERHALVNTSDRVSESLLRLGSEIPTLIDKLSDQQVKLANVIEGAGENLTALEMSLATSVGSLETAVGDRTEQLQNVLENYTSALPWRSAAAPSRCRSPSTTSCSARYLARQPHRKPAGRVRGVCPRARRRARQPRPGARLPAGRAYPLARRRLRRAAAPVRRVHHALDQRHRHRRRREDAGAHQRARRARHQLPRDHRPQATDLDEALMHGINSVRRASENITRQSIKAIEGLSSQSDLLKNISENLLGQISSVTGRFENQGQQIMKAANALETANFKIDKTLQNRHAELAQTLDRLSGKADEFASFVDDYSSTIEGSLSEADLRARGELERMRAHTSAESDRTIEDLRHRLTSVSTTMTTELGSLSNRFAATSEEMRQQASRAAADIAAEQARLRDQMERLPVTAQESSEGMRRALQDQIKALDHLSQLAARSAVQRDVTPPPPPLQSETCTPRPQPAPRAHEQARSITSLSSTIAQELGNRQRQRATPAPDNREGWSLGDLLARASRDEEGHGHQGGAPRQPAQPPSTSISKLSPAPSTRPPPPPSGSACARANAASWCAASTATRGAPCSTTSATAAATTANYRAR